MPLELTTDNVLELWELGNGARLTMCERLKYYKGKQAILCEAAERPDGAKRTKVITNWVRKIVDEHTAFALGNPAAYTLSDPDPTDEDQESLGEQERKKEALAAFEEVRRANVLNAIDCEHYRFSILQGCSVEVVSFDSATKSIETTRYSAADWVALYDSQQTLVGAIYRTVLPVGTIVGGKPLSEEKVSWWAYDDSNVIVYTETKVQRDDKNVSVLTEESRTPHHLGIVPVIFFRVQEDREPFITEAIISLQDAYNSSHSNLKDDVKYNVDAILALFGYEPAALFEKDGDGVAFIEKLRAHKVLPLRCTTECDAKFLEKGNAKDKVEYDINVCRDDIHMSGAIADVSRIVGATGTVSGIALRLKLKPQIGQALAFWKWFEEGLRRRISILNAIWRVQQRPMLTDYLVGANLDIPENQAEVWQNIPNLTQILSRVDVIRFLKNVADAEQASQRKEQEEKELLPEVQFPSDGPPDNTPVPDEGDDQGNKAA